VKRLLLDTNVVIWLLTGNREAISKRALGCLLNEDNAILVSAVSPWEIATKQSVARLELGSNWQKSLLQLDFDLMPITAEHASRIEDLPWHHRDPFDRMLVVQAMMETCSIVSSDECLEDYEVEVIW